MAIHMAAHALREEREKRERETVSSNVNLERANYKNSLGEPTVKPQDELTQTESAFV